MGLHEHHRAVRFPTARRDPELTVVEGFHALKHALRFGAELVEAVAVDPSSLDAMAAELAPDMAGPLAQRGGEGGKETPGGLGAPVPPTRGAAVAPPPGGRPAAAPPAPGAAP